MNHRISFFIIAFSLLAGAPLSAKDPITVTEADGTVTALPRDGIIEFVKDVRANPRTLTLTVLTHPFQFNVTKDAADQAVAIRFISPELGIDKTFAGPNTVQTVDRVEDFLRSQEFLAPFFRLVNAGGPGATFSGNPNGTIESSARAAFGAVLLEQPATAEESEAASKSGMGFRDLTLGLGFSQFDSDGFDGSRLKVSPAYTLKLGRDKQKKLAFNLPLERITVEGLQTYRAGTQVQYVQPVALPGDITWQAAPDVSYSVLGSLDIPSYSGTIGGGLANTLGKTAGPYFGNAGFYYAYFTNLGGIDTNLSANLYSYGLQLGRRLGKRWAVSAYGVGMVEKLNYGSGKDYQTAGVSLLYRILNRFNLEVSVNKTFNLPGYSDTSFSFGSGWNF